ncbi:hypothetical protein [Methylococcus geothermalis]|uniref:DUF4156 domain-containing protein n=1 Tax=Methylococcus geothermalis TaxID=2681310 RepID=A0A858Q455_9GAMM|nr:hypothetical protein [Methylococcus geothermalis]QJD28620.1 hypothetical protein GNH96_00650 [Methylococcus geothermalis]
MLTKTTTTMGIVLTFGLLAGQAHAKPDIVTEDDVKSCRFLKTVMGSSGYGKNLGGWQPQAKASAEKEASQIGASHIVWGELRSSGAFNGIATAKAYDCGR